MLMYIIISAKRLAKIKTNKNSIQKHVNGYGLSKLTNHRFNVNSRFHLGAKLCCLNDHIKLTIRTGEADKIL